MPVYEDDSFVSDSTIGIPSGYFISHPGKLHHNSYLERTVNWQQGKNVLCVLGTYMLTLASPLRKNYVTMIEYTAKKEFLSYMNHLFSMVAESPNSFTVTQVNERMKFFTDYLRKNNSQLNRFGSD